MKPILGNCVVLLEVRITLVPMDDVAVQPDREMVLRNLGGIADGFKEELTKLGRMGLVPVGFAYRVGEKDNG